MSENEIFLYVVIFVLSVIVGIELIKKVPPTLHTPLMSGANAISGITIVGALLSIPYTEPTTANVLGFIALTLATINVVGGFLVTNRILGMFGSKKKILKSSKNTKK